MKLAASILWNRFAQPVFTVTSPSLDCARLLQFTTHYSFMATVVMDTKETLSSGLDAMSDSRDTEETLSSDAVSNSKQESSLEDRITKTQKNSRRGRSLKADTRNSSKDETCISKRLTDKNKMTTLTREDKNNPRIKQSSKIDPADGSVENEISTGYKHAYHRRRSRSKIEVGNLHQHHNPVKDSVNELSTHRNVSHVKSDTCGSANRGSATVRLRSVIAEICGTIGKSQKATRPVRCRENEAGRRPRKFHDSGRYVRSGERSRSNDHSSSSQPLQRKVRRSGSRKPLQKLSDSIPRNRANRRENGDHEPMIPIVAQMFKMSCSQTLNQSSHISSSSYHSADSSADGQPSELGAGNVETSNAAIKIRHKDNMLKTHSEPNLLSELEEGEIIDNDDSEHVHRKKKRKFKYTRKDVCKAPLTSLPKKFNDDKAVSSKKLSHERRAASCQERPQVNKDKWWKKPERNKESRYRTRSMVRNEQILLPSVLQKPLVVKQEVQQAEEKQKLSSSTRLLEEGELASDLDSNTNIIEMSSESGSDMSICSEVGDVVSNIVCDNGQVLLTDGISDSSSIVLKQTQTESTNLNALASAFVPKCIEVCSSDQGSHLHTSSTSIQNSYSTFNQGDQSWIFPSYSISDTYASPAACDTPNSQAAPDTINTQVTPILSCMPSSQHYTQMTLESYFRPPTLQGSCISSTSCIHTKDSFARQFPDFDRGDTREFSSQTFNSQINLDLSGEITCPEMTKTPRYWCDVNRVNVEPDNLVFTVMSYNILSQELMERHMFLYSRCRKSDLEWTNRGAALLTQILAHDSDIVCLQEVQEDHWVQDLKNTFAKRGYRSVYKKPADGDKPDGCAILFKESKFVQLKVVPVEFNKGGILDRSNIGLILLLQPRVDVYKGSVRKICVATTHLLFNPRRGDVKLAQLAVFLAEIDKHAYVDDEPASNKKCLSEMDGDVSSNNNFISNNLTRENCSQGSTCDGLDKIEDSGPLSEISLKDETTSTHYCPIILCGDFNTEPFSDMYKFITTGYLKYDELISRYVCGQEEGRWGGSDRLVDKRLLPHHLSICETCQYVQVLKERQHKDGWTRQQQPKINSGQFFHKMNFRSAYTHYVDSDCRKKEVSTHHNNCSCTVDYIFYSNSRPGEIQNASGDSSSSPCRESNLSEKQQVDNTHKLNNDFVREPLELLARYRLLTSSEVARFGFMPNSILPSDHLCLIAKFILR